MKYNRQTPCIYTNLNVVYHGIPKNASTSVKNALYEYQHGYEFNGNKQWVHKGNSKGGSIYPDVTTIQSLFADWFHFTVVRNPIERFKSFYNDLFAGTTSIRNNVPTFYSDNNIKLKPKPVDAVLDMVEEYPDEEADEHFASQCSFIHYDPINIVKLEDLKNGWKNITSLINVDYKPLSVYNKSIDTTELNGTQVKRIYTRYQNDFERFGYQI